MIDIVKNGASQLQQRCTKCFWVGMDVIVGDIGATSPVGKSSTGRERIGRSFLTKTAMLLKVDHSDIPFSFLL